MSLLFVPSANQISNLSVSASSQYLGSTLTFSISTQGYSTGDTIYYTTTGGGQQLTGTAVVTNYLGDLGTASIPIATSRTTSTSVFTATFYNGTTPVNLISGSSPQATLSLIAPDPYFTATTLLISSAGPGPTALTDLSGTTSTIQVVGSTNVRSLTPFSTPGVSSSIYFNGSTDYLASPQTTSLTFGTGNFTVEFWMYFTGASVAGEYDIIEANPAAGSFQIYISASTQGLKWGTYGSTSFLIAAAGSIPVGRWTHVAISRSGTGAGQTLAFVNGSQTLSTADGNNYTGVGFGIGGRNTGVQFFTGYLSNIRVVKGVAVYTGNFTVPTSPLQLTQSAGTNIAAITSGQTSLLLAQPAQAQNNTGSFDSATTATQIAYVSTPTQGTFSPYSAYANYFNGAVYQTIQASSATALGTGDFTIEFWAYPTVNQRQDWFDINDGTGPRLLVYYDISGNIIYYGNGATRITGSAMVLNTWQHIAVVRISGVTKLYINGTQSGSNYTDTINYPSQPLTVGKDSAASTYVTGYIRNLRLIKGQGIYTAAFTPPTLTTQLATTTNTVILAQGPFSTTSTDYSTVTNTVTNVGSIPARLISTTTFLTTPYSTSTIGGSIYFDGNSYMSISTGTIGVFAFGSNNFSLEAWIYPTSNASQQIIFNKVANGSVAGAFDLRLNQAGTLSYFADSNAGGGWDILQNPTLSFVTFNNWNHVAFIRVGDWYRSYINGCPTGAAVYNGTISLVDEPTVPINIGANADGSGGKFNGYMTGIRMVRNYSFYATNTNFNPPLTPPTASLTGTTMVLLNGNSSAIYDSAGFNNIITVNTASLVTTPVKFGSNSIQLLGNSYLNVVSSTGTSFGSIIGTADFTAEMWIYPTASGTPYLMAIGSEAAGRYVIYLVSGVLTTNYYGAGAVSMGGSIGTNYWTHVAVARQGSTIRGFINGVLQGTAETNSSSIGNNNIIKVGADASGNSTFQGYMSDVRLTKGIARYTASFTTATTYLPLI